MTHHRAIASVVSQHVEELAFLWHSRRVLASAGYVGLHQLARLDERIRAHEDGCLVAGPAARSRLEIGLAEPDAAPMFAAAVVALAARDPTAFDHCLTVGETAPDAIPGLRSALGWTASSRLTGLVKEMLCSGSALHRRLGFAACRCHGADPGFALIAAVRDTDAGLRAEAFRTAGHLGRQDLLPACLDGLADDNADCGFWAAWSAALLGNRGVALDALTAIAITPGPHRASAFGLVVQAMTQGAAHGLLQRLAVRPQSLRWLIQGSGLSGNTTYIPWLIAHMSNDATARLAGDAFRVLTGADLPELNLEREAPDDLESGPNDDPDDPNVELDPDDGLPWPDGEKIGSWWASHGTGFQAGTRYFMGAPVTREHCGEVLKTGYQRQRILAAHYLCLLNPGTPLFNTSAPAWRQQRLLADMK